MDVGIRELKAHLSEFIERAANGEQIRVTDRGTPKAVINALPGRFRLDEGIQEGWITVGHAADSPPVDVKPVPSSSRSIDVINEDRGL